MEKKPDVYNPTFWHYLLIMPLFIIIRLLIATVRLKYDEKTKLNCTNPTNMLGVAWHRYILFLAKAKIFFRPIPTMSGLVSASKDGAYLVAFFNLMGIRSIRGSRKRRGREAIYDLVEALKTDSDAFITPDGPKGPTCVAKKGFFIVAENAGCRIILVRFRPYNFITIPTWDKFVIPLPFSKVEIQVRNFENSVELEKSASACGMTVEEFATAYCNGEIEIQ